MFLRVCPVCRGERRIVKLGAVDIDGATYPTPVVELCAACDGEGLIRREPPAPPAEGGDGLTDNERWMAEADGPWSSQRAAAPPAEGDDE